MFKASELVIRYSSSLFCPSLRVIFLRTNATTTHGEAQIASEISEKLLFSGKSSENGRPHIPVMPKEIIQMLEPRNGQTFIDMTFGAGGHTEAILKAAKSAKVYALDRDPVAFEYAKKLSQSYGGQVYPMLGRFSDLDQLLQKQGVPKNSVDGILLDAGVSSMQMDNPGRGFALSKDGPLDMRMDGHRVPNQPSASDVVNTLDERSLAKIFKIYGEEKHALRVARAIVEAKYMLKNINTTRELAALVEVAIDDENRLDQLRRPSHVATKIFQSLRIFVNNELNELNHAMHLAHDYMKEGGTLVAVTFHSLEDRIVKRHLMGIDMDETFNSSVSQKYKCAGKWLSKEEVLAIYNNHWTPKNKKVMTPSLEEIQSNPRIRSAKLRAAVKCVPK